MQMFKSKKCSEFLLVTLMSFGLALPALAGPTPMATPTATPTPGPQPETGCACIVQGVTPTGNVATLRNTGDNRKGSTQDDTITVNIRAESRTPGSCTAGDSSEPINVTLRMVDDDGDVIADSTKIGYRCFGTQEGQNNLTFLARYKRVNCEGSVAPPPGSGSTGEIDVTVTTGHDEFEGTRGIECHH
jgi:hypothetical protein